MKRKMLMLSLVLGFGLLLTGCFRSPSEQIGDKMGEQFAEKMIESQTGGKVDVDADNGTMSVKDENSSMEVSTGGAVDLPEDFPKELVIPKDAKVIIASTMDKTTSVSYETDSDKKGLSEDYISLLTGKGWEKKLEMDLDTSLMVSFENEEATLSCIISDNSDSKNEAKTIVSLTLVQK